MPPDMLPGQLALNDPGDGVTLMRLFGGTLPSLLYPTGVATLVSNLRQVELTGLQHITGDKFINVSNIHITGGSHGDALVTDGLGNLVWQSGGGGIFPEAPTDGRTYGRDGLSQSWVPVLPLTGGNITGDVHIIGGDLTVNGDGVVTDAPIDGRLYVRSNGTWVILPWEWPGDGTGTPGGGIPEAPADGLIYGRDGQTTSWVPVLPLSGGTMLGSLVLAGSPVPGGNPNQAATMAYVDSKITGALQFIGTMDASTNTVTFTTSSGLPPGPLPPAFSVPDRYVIVTVAGTLDAPPELAGKTVQVGDWIVSDGSTWDIIAIGGGGSEIFASNVIVSPPVAGEDNVQTALTQLLSLIGQNAFPEAPTDGQIYGRDGQTKSWIATLPLSGGTMVGSLILDGPPTATSPPNQAATRGYVDGLVMGALGFIGTMDATTGNVTYTVTSGHPAGPLLPANQAADSYVIIAVGGTVPSGPVAGAVVNTGDWLISDGVNWMVIHVAPMVMLASNVTVNPTILGQTDVQGALNVLATAVTTLQSQVTTFLTSVSTIGDVYSTGVAGP